jgi:hypothetical protein
LISRLLREPLLQFLALGAILFVLFAFVDKRGTETPEKIVVSASRIANLADGFSRTWRRQPSREELQNLIEDYVRDEVFYRAGRAAGLDRDDVVIRRRVRQKMEFLAEEISIPEPSEGELAAFLADNPDRFRMEDRLSFHHVFLSPARRAGTIDQDLKQVEAAVSNSAAPAAAADLGDPFLLGGEFSAVSQRDVASTFGDGFARRIFPSSRNDGRGRSPRPLDSISCSSPIAARVACRHWTWSGQRLSGNGPMHGGANRNRNFTARCGIDTKSALKESHSRLRLRVHDPAVAVAVDAWRPVGGAGIFG